MTSITADQTAPGPARSPMLAVRVQDLADMTGLDPACVGDLLSGGACLCCDANPVIGVAQRHSPGGMTGPAEPLVRAVRVQDLSDMIGLHPACVGDHPTGGPCLCCDANPVIGVAQRHSLGGMASLAEPLA